MAVVLVLVLLIVICGGLWLWSIAGLRADFSQFKKFDYAHRGLHDKDQGVPENSMKAFSLAVLCGFGMEFDLQLTKDNVVVVHHDHSIKRTCGVDKLISDLTLEELRQYRLFGTEEQIPLFADVLKLVDGKTPLIIELKGYNDVDALCSLAMKELEGYEGLYCVESFDPRIVQWFRKHHPHIVRGQLMMRFKKGIEGQTAAQAFFGRNLMTNWATRPHFEAYDFNTRDIFALRTARRMGLQEVSWTIRTEEDYRKVKALGNLCIFEQFIPVKGEDAEKETFADVLKAYGKSGAVAVSAQTGTEG